MSIIEEIKSEIERSENKANENGLLNIKMANTWVKEAKSRPNPHTWFHGLIVANENTVISAVSNVGKSILAVQIAEEIAKKSCIWIWNCPTNSSRCDIQWGTQSIIFLITLCVQR